MKNLISLNTEFQNEMPFEVIIDKRLKQLYSHYGQLLIKVGHGKTQNREISRHIANLQLTYGIKLVKDVWTLVFIPNIIKTNKQNKRGII